MRHLARFAIRENFVKPYNVQCSCGVGGEFVSQDEARAWMQTQHFARLTGIAYGEFAEQDPLPDVTGAERGNETPELHLPKSSNPTIPKGNVVAEVLTPGASDAAPATGEEKQ